MMLAIMRRSVLFVGVFALVVGAGGPAGLAAQEGGATIDFRVLNPDGTPVRDLKPEEVQIRVAGRQRAIKSLRLVDAGAGGGGAAAPAASVLPPPFGTNAGGSGATAGGRAILIIVDDEALPVGGERAVRDAVTSYVDALSPGDRVAFAIAPRDTAGVGLGSDVARIKEALTKLSGRQRGSSPVVIDTEQTLLLIRSMLAPLAGTESPVTVLFFASRLASPSADSSVNTSFFQEMGTAAAAARAQFYIINSDVSVAQRSEGLETLASVTGAGTVLRLAGQPDLLKRIATETSAYYVATIDGESTDRGASGQRLDLRVSRDGVQTRSRPEVVFARTAAAAGGKPGAASTPRDMLRDPRPFNDLEVRTRGVAARDTGGRMRVTVFSEAADPAVKLSAAEVALIDPSNKFAPTSVDQKQLAGRPIVTAHSVAPGKYRLRFAAVDASGKGGAADYDVDASLTDAGTLKMSGLLLFGAGDANAFSPRLVFRDEAAVAAYLEIYGDVAAAPVAARVEIASSVDGAAIASVQPGGKGTSEADRFILTAQLPLDKLAPGDYIVRAFVKQGEGAEGRVIATLRKLAK
jgi:hypothetical protein